MSIKGFQCGYFKALATIHLDNQGQMKLKKAAWAASCWSWNWWCASFFSFLNTLSNTSNYTQYSQSKIVNNLFQMIMQVWLLLEDVQSGDFPSLFAPHNNTSPLSLVLCWATRSMVWTPTLQARHRRHDARHIRHFAWRTLCQTLTPITTPITCPAIGHSLMVLKTNNCLLSTERLREAPSRA